MNTAHQLLHIPQQPLFRGGNNSAIKAKVGQEHTSTKLPCFRDLPHRL